MPYVHAIQFYAQCGKELAPADLRHELLQLAQRHFVVVGNRIAQLYIVLGGLGQTSLQAEHGLSGFFRFGQTVQSEHVGYVLLVFGADVQGMLVGIDVILLLA